MKIKPYRTLPLRLRLKLSGRNALIERAAPLLDRYYARFNQRQGSVDLSGCYLQLEIHPYALIGHQIASWIHGYLWASDLGVSYLGDEISRDTAGLFNFDVRTAERPAPGAKKIKLSWVADERDARSLRILRGQMLRARERYPQGPIVFQLALDPARYDQVPAEDVVRDAMLLGYKGSQFLEAEQNSDYVALHVRRGSDIHESHVSGKESVNRWVLEEWHAEVIQGLRAIPSIRDKEIRVYALGQPEDFPLLTQAGVTLKLNGDRDTDLMELAAARLLVLSPSSFSFTAALASRAVVLGRVPWWHHIPNTGRWVHIRPDGSFDSGRVQALMESED